MCIRDSISTIGRLSGSIVHDLRNPLAAIYGGAEMLVDADLPPAHVKRLAANIYRASRRIQELLQDLLNVSRGKTGTPELCRLREVASAACDSLAATARAQAVAIGLSIPPEFELPLDRSRMERAFVNLIANALEAMPDGGEIRISASLEENGGAGDAAVLVRVEDTGPGIAPEIRSKLFQPFVTAGKRNGPVSYTHLDVYKRQLKLTPAEYNLLCYFLHNPDRPLTRDMILNSVWGYEFFPNTRTVDAHVVKLRQKLEPDPNTPRHFLTVHGVGYRFLP